DHVGVVGGHVAVEQPGAAGRDDPLRAQVVLDRDRDASKGPQRLTCTPCHFECGGCTRGTLPVDTKEGVELAGAGLPCPREGIGRQGRRCELAFGNRFDQRSHTCEATGHSPRTFGTENPPSRVAGAAARAASWSRDTWG